MKSWKQVLVAVCASLLLASCGGSSSLSNLIPLFDGETYLYFNSRGETVIKPVVNVMETSMFYEGLALAGLRTDDGRRYGFLNGKGELAIPAKYLHATVFREGLAWVVEPNRTPAAIDKRGEIVFTMSDAEEVNCFHEGLAVFSRKNPEGNTLYGFVDKKGKVVIEPVYRLALDFSNGLAPVMLNEKMGYINRKGEMEIPEQFAVAAPFNASGYARVMSSEDHYGVIDRKGVYVLNPTYKVLLIDGTHFLVEENEKHGVMDKSGKFIIPPDFKMLMPFFGEPFTTASLDGKRYGIVDRKGKFTVNPQFDYGSSFIRGVAVVVQSLQVGIVDVKGKYVVNPRYEKPCEEVFSPWLAGVIYATVKTDYFDMDAVVNQILRSDGTDDFRGIAPSTTCSGVKAKYPKLSTNYFSSTHYSYDDIELAGGAYITSVNFTFNGPLSKREYNYYDRKYATVELNPTVQSAEYEILFRDEKGKSKRAEIGELIAQTVTQRYSLTEDSDARGTGRYYAGDRMSFRISTTTNSIRIKVTY
jgi:hypothetical protein